MSEVTMCRQRRAQNQHGDVVELMTHRHSKLKYFIESLSNKQFMAWRLPGLRLPQNVLSLHRIMQKYCHNMRTLENSLQKMNGCHA